MGKLDSWIRHAGFGDDIERLKSEVRRVGMVVCAVKGRAVGSNQPLLAQSLSILRELLYDADDVVDQLDYYRLQQQVVQTHRVATTAAATTTAMHRADEISSGNAADTPMNSSVGKLRSAVWEHFRITEKDHGKPVKSACTYCGKEFTCKTRNGTSSMSKHVKMICTNRPPGAHQPNPSSTGDATQITSDSSSGKSRKTHQESTQTATNSTHIHWDKVELSNSIQKLTSQLHNIQGEVSEVLKLCGSGSASSSNHQPSITSDQHLPSSSLVLKKLYGRAAEMDTIKRLITVKKSNGVIVLPIVGIGGVGKTTLAQLVYNDPGVKSKFDHRIWIWVSRNFDEMRFTREMLDFVPQETHEVPQERHEGISSFAKLQEILASRTNSKRLLLVLDDVWYDTDDRRWIQLLAPIKSNAANGNAILVTTRKLSVAEMIGTTEPIKLGALETDYFWLLFKLHAFGDENYKGDQTLSDIGQEIAEKLKGNPLAAESTGKL
uniref:Uncharacterized protein n=1 Tax=Avena sativa TaxID=4498 RepID=A0ACD5WKH1_AVESA